LSSRAKEELKLDREEESDPAVLPEVKPDARSCTALSAAKGLVTDRGDIRYWGEEFLFMVDTSAMVSLIQPGISRARVQPCDVQASGVIGTHLDILAEQEVKFTLRCKDGLMTFVHAFVAFSVWISCSEWGLKSV
jgi:hypothetical protein